MPKRILKTETQFRGAYLNSDDAAEYCGYTAARFQYPRRTFMRMVARAGIPKCYVGRRTRFLIRDLDEYLQRLRPSA